MDAVVQETVVETEVPFFAHLPFQVGVGVLGHLERLDPLAVHGEHITIVGKLIDVLSQVVVARGDTRHTIAHTQTQVVEPRTGAFHERLVHDVPAQGNRGEGSPLVVGTELGTTLMTDANQSIVFVGIAITDTTEETYQLTVVLVAAHPGVVVLVVDERTIAQVVPQEGGGREVLVAGVEAVALIEEITVTHDAVEAVLAPLGIIARGQL